MSISLLLHRLAIKDKYHCCATSQVKGSAIKTLSSWLQLSVYYKRRNLFPIPICSAEFNLNLLGKSLQFPRLTPSTSGMFFAIFSLQPVTCTLLPIQTLNMQHGASPFCLPLQPVKDLWTRTLYIGFVSK